MDAAIQVQPIVLDARLMAAIWGFVVLAFTVGGVYATIRWGLKSILEKHVNLERRVNQLAREAKETGERRRERRESEKQKIETAIKNIETAISTRLETQSAWFKTVLFRSDGITNYLPRSECEQCRLSCQTRLDNRLESIQRMYEEGERRREKSKDDIVQMFTKLSSELGELTGSMKEHNKRGEK